MNVLLIGTGKLAWNLIPALQQRGIFVSGIVGRNAAAVSQYSAAYDIAGLLLEDLLAGPPLQDTLLVVAVSDGAIAALAAQLAPVVGAGSLVVHTSGSVPMAALSATIPIAQCGVFYPMQIFTLDTLADFSIIPFFLEGEESVVARLRPLAEALSSRVQVLDSAGRARLHLGAVLVSNFPNYLYTLAASLVPGAGIWAYEALIHEHIRKVFAFGPTHTQTGPAVRGDRQTVVRHLDMLAEQPDAQQLYRLLSEAINPGLKEG